jgi:hypothetical protein
MLDRAGRALLADDYPTAGIVLDGSPQLGRKPSSLELRTANSFAYGWAHFGQLRSEWRKNFVDYMRPHSGESFAGKLFVDVGSLACS